MAMCVMNEERFLAHHLACHHALGIQRAYLFFDRSTDQSQHIASAFPWVQSYIIPEKQGAAFTYIADTQRACMDLCLPWARNEGFDWLLFIDPDEFLDAGTPSQSHHSDPALAWLPLLLKRAKKNTWMVRFDVKEAVPVQQDPSEPWYTSHIYFQKEPFLEYRLFHPLTQKEILWKDFLGHRQGKCCVRTNLPVQAYDAHRWTVEQWANLPDRPEYVSLPTEILGHILHFPVTGPQHWRTKYNSFVREPSYWFCQNPVETPKQWWKEICLQPEQETQTYYQKWVAQDQEFLKQEVKKGLVLIDRSLSERILALAPISLPVNPVLDLEPVDFQSYLEGTEPHSRLISQGDFSPHLLPKKSLSGFHLLEMCGLKLFRWAGPNATIQINLSPGIYHGVLETKNLLPFRQLKLLKLSFSEPDWGISSLRAKRGKLQFKVHVKAKAKTTNFLVLNAPTLPLSATDTRRLCVPIFNLNFIPQ